MEYIARKVANHAEEGELLDVELSFTRQATSQEEYHRLRGFRMQFQEFFGGDLHMMEIVSDSDLDKIREANPENKTGEAKILSALSDAIGFALCLLDIPIQRICAKALLWLTILCSMWGRLLTTDLKTPTCSAVSEKGIAVSPMRSGESNLTYLV